MPLGGRGPFMSFVTVVCGGGMVLALLYPLVINAATPRNVGWTVLGVVAVITVILAVGLAIRRSRQRHGRGDELWLASDLIGLPSVGPHPPLTIAADDLVGWFIAEEDARGWGFLTTPSLGVGTYRVMRDDSIEGRLGSEFRGELAYAVIARWTEDGDERERPVVVWASLRRCRGLLTWLRDVAPPGINGSPGTATAAPTTDHPDS